MLYEKKQKNLTVYSTDTGRLCPSCGNPVADCTCSAKQTAPQGDGTVRILRETKGRKGKGVTVVTGVPPKDIAVLGKRLKQVCGSGGTVKDGRIEIQGDHRDRIIQELESQGIKAKKAGG